MIGIYHILHYNHNARVCMFYFDDVILEQKRLFFDKVITLRQEYVINFITVSKKNWSDGAYTI